MPVTVAPRIPKQIGYFDNVGHSHAQDYGASFPDWGATHKMDGFLQPAIYDSIAVGGAVCSWQNQGNFFSGDGGWAHVINEMPRDELWNGYGRTTMSGNTIVGATALPVNDVSLFTYLEYIVVGKGTTCEIVQVTVAPGGSGAGTLTVAAMANAHSTNDPVFHAPRNQGYNPKSQLAVLGYGFNDLQYSGPFAQGTFGSTAGASRGLTPLQHAFRMILAHLRCAVVYPSSHVSVSTTGSWSTLPFGSATVAYPSVYGYGGSINGSVIYATANASTASFTTPPDFLGGTVDLFFVAGTNGGGGLWDVAVAGATSRTVTSALDTRNQNAVNFDATTNAGASTGCVYRLTGLNAGVNVVTATMTANVGGAGIFAGWGIEAPQPPMTAVVHDPRIGGSNASGVYGQLALYAQRTTVTGNATCSASSTNVTFANAFTVGTTTINKAAVFPGDTITLGYGLSTQETRRIVTVTDSTHVVVDAAFVNAHTSELVMVGFQDADLVGGGYTNPSDTQGATSVPGIQGKMRSVMAEFDSWVFEVNLDPAFNTSPTTLTVDTTNTVGDGIHYSDKGHGLAAAEFARVVLAKNWNLKALTAATVSMRRTYNPICGDLNAVATTSGIFPTFTNAYSNYYQIDNTYPRTGFYKDMRTREVFLVGAVYNGTEDGVMFTLPPGYRPEKRTSIVAEGPDGPAIVTVKPDGTVTITSGWAGPEGPYSFNGSYLSGA